MIKISLNKSPLIIYGFISLIALAFIFSCGPRDTGCGSGDYYCVGITSTRPYLAPIKSSNSEDILLSNGTLIVNHRYGNNIDSTTIYDLKQICQSDTICDIVDIVPREDSVVIITPTKCVVFHIYHNIVSEFGNTGPDSSRLINAIYAATDTFGNVYVLDSGDNSVKVYDLNGQFKSRFMAGTGPSSIVCWGDKLYVLDKSNDSIKEFYLDGRATGRVLSTSYLANITAFGICNGLFIVADQNGKRLTAISLSGNIYEVKTDYCFRDILFEFGEIININCEPSGFSVVDYDNNFIVNFRSRIWDKSFTRTGWIM